MTAEPESSGSVIQPVEAQSMDIPLCVDLDGSLLRSDLLVEALFGLVSASPLAALQAPLWLLRGKAELKAGVAQRVNLDVTTLPYNEQLLAYLRKQRAEGRHLVLTTASPKKYAEQVAEHLRLFDEVIATENNINLSGKNKAKALVNRFGEGKFDYAGNARPDLAVWKHAHHAVLVDPEPTVARAVQGVIEVETLIENERPRIKDYLKALRLHQWSKNMLVFLPLLGAHRAGELDLLAHAVLAFISFGLCASSVYLLNDLLDLPADRSHPNKRRRPFAAGTVPIVHGVMLIPILLILAFGLAFLLPALFIAVLALYYMSTLSYSLWLKRVVLVDVLLLAGLYTVRVLAGAAAVELIPSFWLLSFSMFLFLSLALAKRHTELMVLHKHGSEATRGRGYQSSDLEALLSLGSAAGYMAVLVLALYINSPEVGKLYNRPEAIWLLCPLFLYWISRMWLGAHRGKLHDDPIVFALNDHVSRWVMLLTLIIVLTATYAP